MICTNCGSEIPDNATFCPSCGQDFGSMQQPTPPAQQPQPGYQPQPNYQAPQPQPGYQPPQGYTPAAQSSKLPKIIIPIVAGAVVLVAVVVVVLVLVLGGGYKGAVRKYVKALKNADEEAMVKLLPEFMLDEEYDSRDEAIDEYTEYLEHTLDYLEDEYGKIKNVSYEITDADELDEDDIEELEEEASDYYDAEITIAKAYDLEIELTVEGEDDSETDEGYLTVVKIDGRWYLWDF